MNNIIEVRNISKTFNISEGIFSSSAEKVNAVNDVSLKISAGIALGIVGESGSGKTTLANIIADIIKPDKGEVLYKGEIIDAKSLSYKDYRKNVQVVFQDPYSSLNPRLKIITMLKDGFKAHFKSNDYMDIFIQTFAKVGLKEEFLYRYPHEFSGGQRQRISIARALVLDPEVIIADEPVSALDVSVQSQILNIFKELKLRDNKTIILISHDLAVVNFLCDYTIVMYKGVDVEYGKTEDIINNPVHPYTKSLIDSSKNLNTVKFDNKIEAACPFAGRCPSFDKEVCNKELEKKYINDNHYHRCNKN
ncbi:ABC transporter ATP-binding protein [Deferribacteraceae bacterium V6Fe1]|nr:ABC transporter ATP-binding protein [Deferribacteraceae bacterium V6Fe1]